jgi:hypothetical protein
MIIASHIYGFNLRSRNIGSALEAAGTMADFLFFFYFMAHIFMLTAVRRCNYESLCVYKIVPMTVRNNSDLPGK